VIKEFYGENPQQSPHYSRIVNRRHFDRLAGYLGSGRIVHGGQQDPGDLYIAPTVLADPPWEAPIMQEEIFGPILPVLGFESINDVLLKLRDRPAPLALYLFSGDRDTQERVLAGTRSGGVALNDVVMHMVGASLPFGGLGESGMGAYHGRASFDSFTHYRSVLKRSLLVEPGLFFPPPKASLGMVKRTFRWLIGG
jgi:aldehyde dehydrogenase (NAD+)